MTTYTMKPLKSGTRWRVDHNVFALLINVNTGATGSDSTTPSFLSTDLLEGDELWEAPADGSEVKKGDKWLRVMRRNGVALPRPGWTAYIHKGLYICGDFTEDGAIPPPDPVVLSTNYIVTVNEELKRVIVKNANGEPLTGWSASVE